ncbi:hypothetical protein ACGFIY_29770 [Micromonospora chersina]|uniref:hypothetical protein n=1 Tax=Micromonospora chersina TaxID=47854 RepID=UPI00371A3F09
MSGNGGKVPGLAVPVKALAEAVLEKATRLGLTWRLRPATVVSVASDGTIRVLHDGDKVPVRVKSMVGPVAVRSRVMVVKTPPAGNHIVGWVGPPAGPMGVIASVERSGGSTASATAQPVLRLDGVPVKAGRRYTVRTSALLIFSSVAGDAGSARISFTTTGAPATTASTMLTLWNSSAIVTTGDGSGAVLSQDYVPSVDQELSVLLYSQRIQGTGNVRLVAASPTSHRIQLIVEDRGVERPSQGEGFVL